jgi:hypothetical protein
MAVAIDPRTQTEVAPAVYAAQATANANPSPVFVATGFAYVNGVPLWPVGSAFWAPTAKI